MIAQLIKPTSPDIFEVQKYDESIFLAGSIENGVAPEWQKDLIDALADLPITIYNPRRDNWNANLEQRASNPEFNYQVNWEMNRLEMVDTIFMYFAPGTYSPITLLELGAFMDSGKIIVCCPDGFYRKGNVEIVCQRNDIPFYHDLPSAIEKIVTFLSS
jgi:hypothetical protein